MNISVEKLLVKMEEELQLITEENLREKVYSIKILCELILDEKQRKNESPLPTKTATQSYVQPVMPAAAQSFVQPMMPAGQTKKLVVENEEANGDSLFDF